jgi:LAS superfamily LD-carboxypeptidase LdcB
VVGAEADIESDDFAQAVASWQASHGIHPTGVIDNETWSTMIGEFQSQRIKERAYPSSGDLVVAPAVEFYDPERPVELRQVHKATYAAYKRMVAEAMKDQSLELLKTESGELHQSEKFLKIISAFRSREYQDQLRKSSPRAGRAGLARNSPHFTGRALDLYVGGEPVDTKDSNRRIQIETAVYKWLVKNASRFGFRPYFYEPWHWEYVSTANRTH